MLWAKANVTKNMGENRWIGNRYFHIQFPFLESMFFQATVRASGHVTQGQTQGQTQEPEGKNWKITRGDIWKIMEQYSKINEEKSPSRYFRCTWDLPQTSEVFRSFVFSWPWRRRISCWGCLRGINTMLLTTLRYCVWRYLQVISDSDLARVMFLNVLKNFNIFNQQFQRWRQEYWACSSWHCLLFRWPIRLKTDPDNDSCRHWVQR